MYFPQERDTYFKKKNEFSVIHKFGNLNSEVFNDNSKKNICLKKIVYKVELKNIL